MPTETTKDPEAYFGHGPNLWPIQRIRTRYFPIDSLVDQWGDVSKVFGSFILTLDEARHIARIPFIITSGYRDDPESEHSLGLAVDISSTNGRQTHIIEYALRAVGISRRGIYDLHVHAGIGYTREPDRFPPNVLWAGVSR